MKELSNSTTGLLTVANGNNDEDGGNDAGSEASQSEADNDADEPSTRSLGRRSSAPVGLSTGPDRLVFKSQSSELDVNNEAEAFHRVGSTTSSQMSFGSSPIPPGPAYEHVGPVVPEELSIGYADDLFKNCCSKHRVFVDKVLEFKQTVNKFKNSVSSTSTFITTMTDEAMIDYNELNICLRVYVQLLDKEREQQRDTGGTAAVAGGGSEGLPYIPDLSFFCGVHVILFLFENLRSVSFSWSVKQKESLVIFQFVQT